jgi:hypothetical protein
LERRPNFAQAQSMERKQHAEKKVKTTCKEEKQRSTQEKKPKHDRVRVLVDIVTAISL